MAVNQEVCHYTNFARIVQLIERNLGTIEVIGLIPIMGSILWKLLRLAPRTALNTVVGLKT